MAYAQSNQKNHYTRPHSALTFRNVEAMLVDVRLELRRNIVEMPAANKTRPYEFGVFSEATSSKDAIENVICSGAVVLLGGASGAGDHIGVTLKDAVEGEAVTVLTQGKFYLPLDDVGDSGATPARVASSLTGLRNKPAYYLKDLGLFTDQEPASGGQAYLEVGRFYEDVAEIKPGNINHGLYYAVIDLMIVDGQDAVALPAAAGSTAGVPALRQFPEVSDEIGLTFDIWANVYNTDPNSPVPDSAIVWTIDGNTFIGNHANYTFGTDGAKTINLTVTHDGLSIDQDYTLTLSTSAAPTLAEA